MKKNRICLIAISLLLVCTTAINLTGCATKIQAKSLMDGIKPNEVKTLDDLSCLKQSDCKIRNDHILRTEII